MNYIIKLFIVFLLLIIKLNTCVANIHYIPAQEFNFTLNYLKLKNIKITQNFLIIINSKIQKLSLYNLKGALLKSYTISTSKKGLGQLINSKKTPVGAHVIVEKIGDNIPHYGIFKHRIFTKNIWQKEFWATKFRRKDFIVTRILRLKGLEPGINYGKNIYGQNIDSFARAIYIHGTAMEWKLGTPSTIGCIHLSSKDIVELFNLVPVGSIVMIY